MVLRTQECGVCLHLSATDAAAAAALIQPTFPPEGMESESACWIVGGDMRRLDGNKSVWKLLTRLTFFIGLALTLGCCSVARAASAGASHTCVVLEDGSIKVCFELGTDWGGCSCA